VVKSMNLSRDFVYAQSGFSANPRQYDISRNPKNKTVLAECCARALEGFLAWRLQ